MGVVGVVGEVTQVVAVERVSGLPVVVVGDLITMG